MKDKNEIYKVNSISELHDIAGFEKPMHPLVSIMDYSKVDMVGGPESGSFSCSFYAVNLKKHCDFIYGHQPFDHKEGSLHCTAPEQIITFDRRKEEKITEGWGLYFHPELIRNSALGAKIMDYSFFSYSENESLHLSDKEKNLLVSILKQIENEYHTNIDHFSHDLLISNIELLLNYCNRFYGRQFITRSIQNKDVILRFETFIKDYFYTDKLRNHGMPSVKQCAEEMNLSANYFSDLLKSETGKNTQEHIHYHLLEKAKTLLVSTSDSVNEIAYELGFDYPQSFSKLFKKKVGVTPTMFRAG